MTNEEFSSRLSSIQQLCSPAANKAMNAMSGNLPGSKSAFDAVDDNSWDAMYLSESAYSSSTPQQSNATPQITTRTATKSKVPDFIKQSMMNETIDTTALSSNPLDRIDLSSFERPSAPIRKTITEAAPVQATVPSGVDYSIIRALINECIENKFKEYFGERGKLNEGTLKTIHLSGGDINLIDNSGNIYGASLKKKGNVNNKK